MSYKLSFGMYEGKTFEWLFFNAPWYAQWIYHNRIHRQEHNMDEDEGDHFSNLYRRATNLGGTCSRCNERPVSRMGLTFLRGTGQLGQVGFYCDECDASTGVYRASFFVEAVDLPRCEQLRITQEIRQHYIGSGGNLTQKKMGAFFTD